MCATTLQCAGPYLLAFQLLRRRISDALSVCHRRRLLLDRWSCAQMIESRCSKWRSSSSKQIPHHLITSTAIICQSRNVRL